MERIQLKTGVYYFKGQSSEIKPKKENGTHLLDTSGKKVAAGAGLLTLITVAGIKGKSITKAIKKGFNNIFNKGVQPNSKTEKGMAESIPQVKKFILTEPTFTCGEENPIQFAKEKDAYLKSIWEDTIFPMDVEKNVAGLKAIEKYGTMQHIEKLPFEYSMSKDDKIIEAFTKVVAKLGEPEDIHYFLFPLKYSKNSDTKIEVLYLAKELLMKGKLKTFSRNTYSGLKEAVETHTNHTNEQVSRLAKEVLEILPKKYFSK